jgi:hypothetical protein
MKTFLEYFIFIVACGLLVFGIMTFYDYMENDNIHIQDKD